MTSVDFNQATPLEPYDLFSTDPVLADAVVREGAGNEVEDLRRFGQRVGSEEVATWGRDANRFPPELVTHDRFGERIDEVHYHPSYHALLDLSVSEGIHASHYDTVPGDGGYVARNARMYLISQIEVGHGCPLSMTGAALFALDHQPDLAEAWAPGVKTHSYDQRLVEKSEKSGLLLGMAMTERQGGSDVRANTSVAVPAGAGGPGAEYRLTGHKWFTSAPMSDAFLALAYAPKGLSCFLVPRILSDGSRNTLRFNRLKDKLGNKSNASGELEYDDAAGWLVGEEGRGVPTIIEMVGGTRIDVANWAAALMRQAVAQAAWHCAHREAFGAKLVDKPLMQNVLADLEIEAEVGTLMAMRLSGAKERGSIDDREAGVTRLGSAVAKYWLTKRSTPVVREALECVGGNGYVEESALPRLYREAPLNAIWEGSGNVIALDVLRALHRSPDSGEAFASELELARGLDPSVDRAIDTTTAAMTGGPVDEVAARRLIEQMAVCWSAGLLVRHGDEGVARGFIRSRLDGDWGIEFGTLPSDLPLPDISARAVPTA